MASFFVSSNKEALCQGCRGISIESLCGHGGYIHTMSTSGLGPYISCPLCDLIRKYPRSEREIAVLGCQSRLQLSVDGYLEICATGTGIQAPNFVSSIFVRTRKGDSASTSGLSTIVDLTNTASQGSLHQARSWIRDCNSHHQCGNALRYPDVKQILDHEHTRNVQPTSDLAKRNNSERANRKLAKGLPKLGSERTSRKSSFFTKRLNHDREAGPRQGGKVSPNRGGISNTKSTRQYEPKRLIDVDTFGDGSLDARLTDVYDSDTEYVTLSYCWGEPGQSNFITTSKNLNERLSRIDYSMMPTTFKHAFEITRFLGIRYIWIDSLCILQNSVQDWEQESIKMGAIYSNSYVTIAADWGNSANSGCYNTASDTILEGNDSLTRITSILSDCIKSSLYMSWAPSQRIKAIETCPLTTRAWAYQERILSPRILQFTEKQLFWECREEVYTEDMIPRKLPFLHPTITGSSGIGYPLPGIISLLHQSTLESSLITPLGLWYRIIVTAGYATRSLTMASDKLSAISALAKLWSQYIPGLYLAGLWHYQLCKGLCWRRTGLPLQESHIYRCPSWSWASLDCNIYWYANLTVPEHGEEMVRIEGVIFSSKVKIPLVESLEAI